MHNIKELEKTLPGVASISSIQVKDYLQALSDEGKIRVEKIGSGNWYWSFLSEEKANRDTLLNGLTAEKEKVDASVELLREQVKAADAMRGKDGERHGLVTTQVQLEGEVVALKKELEGYKNGDPEEVERKRKEVDVFKIGAERWTDNIAILEGRLKGMLGGSAEHLEAVQREVYGSEYIEGEGLKEL